MAPMHSKPPTQHIHARTVNTPTAYDPEKQQAEIAGAETDEGRANERTYQNAKQLANARALVFIYLIMLCHVPFIHKHMHMAMMMMMRVSHPSASAYPKQAHMISTRMTARSGRSISAEHKTQSTQEESNFKKFKKSQK